MRVSQIQNLTWAGNVLVLVGLGWVGLQFWNARKQKPVEAKKWPTAATVDTGVRWPGELSAFRAIWDTQISGRVPPPPPPPVAAPPVDRWQQFQADLKYAGGMEVKPDAEESTVHFSYKGKELWVQPGGMVGDSQFQLLRFSIDASKRESSGDVAELVFRHPDTGAELTWTQTVPPKIPFGLPPLIEPRKFEGSVERGRISQRGPLVRRAFVDKNGEWIIPEEELLWLEEYGEADLWSKLVVKPDMEQGVSRGLRIMTPIEQGTPLASSHGINVDDIVRSINGVAMTSKEDVLNYLRGDGKLLTKFSVVVESKGQTRTIVYKTKGRQPGR